MEIIFFEEGVNIHHLTFRVRGVFICLLCFFVLVVLVCLLGFVWEFAAEQYT